MRPSPAQAGAEDGSNSAARRNSCSARTILPAPIVEQAVQEVHLGALAGLTFHLLQKPPAALAVSSPEVRASQREQHAHLAGSGRIDLFQLQDAAPKIPRLC